MKREVSEKWLELLESGDFQQGQSYLNHNGKYCCLGVLCVAANATWKPEYEYAPLELLIPTIDGEENSGSEYFEDDFKDLLGIDPVLHTICWNMNDGLGDTGAGAHSTTKIRAEYMRSLGIEIRRHSFKEIAKFLRPYLLEGKELPPVPEGFNF